MDTEITATVVRATESGTSEGCTVLRDSHPSPVFSDTRIHIFDIRFDPGSGVRGRLLVSGRVTSNLCDLVPGDSGTIQEVGVWVNGDFLVSVGTRIEKGVCEGSFVRPYPMVARFEADLGEVELSTGTNWFELQATTRVSGVRLAGYVNFNAIIRAERKVARAVPQRESPRSSPPPLPPSQMDEWDLSCDEPTLERRSMGDETHAYYVRLSGPLNVLKNLSRQPQRSVVPASDGRYYIADRNGKPEASVLVALQACNSLSSRSDDESETFEVGFLRGYLVKGARFVCGSLRLGGTSEGGSGAIVLPTPAGSGLLGNSMALDHSCQLPSSIPECSRAVQALHQFTEAVKMKDYPIIESVAKTEWEPLARESKELAMVGLFCLELLEEVWEEFGQRGNRSVCGRIAGRACLETLACILAYPEGSTVRKLDVLTKLKEVNFSDDSRGIRLVDRIITLWRSGPFGAS